MKDKPHIYVFLMIERFLITFDAFSVQRRPEAFFLSEHK